MTHLYVVLAELVLHEIANLRSDNKGSIPLQHILPLSFIGLGRYSVTVEGRVRLSLRALSLC